MFSAVELAKPFSQKMGLPAFKAKLLQLKLKAFEPKLGFCLDMGRYQIKTAESVDELQKVLRLRHEMFVKRYRGKSSFMGIDFDRYDLLGDHILVIDKERNIVVGTYRLIGSTFSKEFYSSQEFVLDEFLSSPGIKLELGRACINDDYRSGVGLNLVWKGLAQYAVLTNARYMFGCSSIKTTSYACASLLFKHLYKDHYSSEYDIWPTEKYRFQKREISDLPFAEAKAAEELIPPLMASYLKAGAKVFGFPALDRPFKCIDFLTILDLSQLEIKYRRRYFDSGRG